MRVAAGLTTASKLASWFSYPVAMARQGLSFAKTRSILSRRRHRNLANRSHRNPPWLWRRSGLLRPKPERLVDS